MGVTQFLQAHLGRVFTFLIILSIILIVLNLSIRKKNDYFVSFKIKDLATIHIDSPEGQFIIRKGISDTETEWMVDQHGKTSKMDHKIPLAYFTVLARIQVVEKFPISEFTTAQLNQIFVKNAKGEIDIKLKSGAAINITIGEATPSGTELYTTSSADPKTVYTISNRYAPLLFPSLIELRQHQIIDTTNMASISISYNGSEIVLINADGKWFTHDTRLNGATLQDLLKALKSIFFNNYFPDVPETDLAQYGLLVPDITIRSTTRSNQQNDIIISRYGTGYYMTPANGEKRDVYILNNSSALALESLLLKINK